MLHFLIIHFQVQISEARGQITSSSGENWPNADGAVGSPPGGCRAPAEGKTESSPGTQAPAEIEHQALLV